MEWQCASTTNVRAPVAAMQPRPSPPSISSPSVRAPPFTPPPPSPPLPPPPFCASPPPLFSFFPPPALPSVARARRAARLLLTSPSPLPESGAIACAAVHAAAAVAPTSAAPVSYKGATVGATAVARSNGDPTPSPSVLPHLLQNQIPTPPTAPRIRCHRLVSVG